MCARDRDHTFGYGDDDLGPHFIAEGESADFLTGPLLICSTWVTPIADGD